MRKFYMILLVALVALSIAACGGKGKERPLPVGSVVVALGDSITQGVGASEQSVAGKFSALERLASDKRGSFWRY